MDFDLINISNSKWTIVKQILFNTDPYKEEKLWVYSSGVEIGYDFVCPNCKICRSKIDIKNVLGFKSNDAIISIAELIEYGGAGMLFKVLKCNSCESHYYFGFGYIEPNNGWDVYVLHTILEIEAYEEV